jgi:hypothetical protein
LTDIAQSTSFATITAASHQFLSLYMLSISEPQLVSRAYCTGT